MRLDTDLRTRLNELCYQYSGWQSASSISKFFDQLSNNFGIDLLIAGSPDKIADDGTKSWSVLYTINNNLIDNSYFIYQVYEGTDLSLLNEYTMYFS